MSIDPSGGWCRQARGKRTEVKLRRKKNYLRHGRRVWFVEVAAIIRPIYCCKKPMRDQWDIVPWRRISR